MFFNKKAGVRGLFGFAKLFRIYSGESGVVGYSIIFRACSGSSI